MTILALDTSGTTASVALLNEHIVLAESGVTLADLRGADGRYSSRRKTHSETLMPMVDELFNISGLSLKDVDRIACTCGPGSFTGLRIGASAAKGLAFAANKHLIAVPTLDALAYTVASLMPETWVVPMLDARREQVYSAIYHKNERVTDYLAAPVSDVVKIVEEKTKDDEVIFIGDGAEAYRSQLKFGRFAPFCHNRLRAACVGSVALNMPPADESEFTLLYVRKPQAERERERRLNCSG